MYNPDYSSVPMTQQGKAFAIIAITVFLCCLLGILTRPLSFLAFFWPANAALLAIFLRFPQLNNAGGWIGAFTAYMTADLLTGNGFDLTFFLSLSNLLNVSVSLFFINYFQINYRNYNKGLTFLYLFAICAFAGCLAGAAFAVFTIPHVPNTFMSADRFWIDFGMWWTGELVNAILIIPLILSMPTLGELKLAFHERKHKQYPLSHIFPLIAIFICVLMTYFLAGPGALLYPLAALIWAALTYRLFSVAVINFAVLLATYHSLNQFYLSESSSAYLSTSISVRIGLFMLSLAPLILCIISQNRHELFKQVLYLANHDSLTLAMTRRYFFQQSELLMQNAKRHPFSIIMLDIDHFKNLNDQHGHYAGDLVLQHFARTVQHNLRNNDLFARIGGEEFVIFLQNVQLQEAHAIAERIRAITENSPISIHTKAPLHITVSIGIMHHNFTEQKTLQSLINNADNALYQAKKQGRNQVASFNSPEFSSAIQL